MKFLPVLFAALLAFAACSVGPTPEEQAAEAALSYYRQLAEGDTEGFLNGKVGADSLPADYRAELIAACRRYLHDVEQQHQGISDVRVSNARRDSSLHLTYALLLLSFADSAKEEVVVPMVEHDGRWMMK